MRTSRRPIDRAFLIAWALVAGTLAAGVAAPSAALAQETLWIKIDGIEGEATADGHQKEIALISYSQSATRPDKGRPTCDPLIVTKSIDKASPILIANVFKGRPSNAVISARRARAEDPVDYLRVTLTGVCIDSVTYSTFTTGDPATESVTMSYEKFEIAYTPVGSDGPPQGEVSFRWDCRRATEG